ncbi:MAG: diguanylate cyclase [Gammaproteobacteria bacterium]|nr:diguanylate cyclase [Gammaproteobacteria bacterium]
MTVRFVNRFRFRFKNPSRRVDKGSRRVVWRSRFLHVALGALLVVPIVQPHPESPMDSAPSRSIRLTDEEREYLTRNPVIRKCVDPHWMPLEGIEDGQHVGIIADLLEIVEQRLGVRFELAPTADWAESLRKLEARECDIVTSDAGVGDPSPYYLKTRPFLNMRNVYITRKSEPIPLGFEAIKDRTIGIPAGYPTLKLIPQRYGAVNIVEVKDVDDGVLKVSDGEIYAFTELLPVCSYAIERLGLTNLKVAGHLDISFPTVMSVRSDRPVLLNIMNKALASVDSKTLQRLFSRWISVEYHLLVNWTQVLQYLSIALVIIAVILYWNRKLRIVNKQLDALNAELALLNETDSLTQLKNRNFLCHRLPGLLRLAARHRLSLSIVMLDVDRFKTLNDTYGHVAGDQCLEVFARKMRSIFRRETDWLVRYGGEEFLLICSGVSVGGLAKSLECFRREVETLRVDLPDGRTLSVTVSVGYVFYPVSPADWDDALIVEADENLYEAKRNGRNCIVGTVKPDNPPSDPD